MSSPSVTAAEAVDSGARRRPMPPELSATILAVAAVLVGGILGMPVYGVFLGWAAASLARRGGIPSRVVLLCLAAGGVLGAATLAATAVVAPLLGPNAPEWLSAVLSLAVANPILILLGRLRAFAAVPAMFIGFSTLLAVHLGSTHELTDGLLGALLVASATNLAGVGVNWLGERMTRLHGPSGSPGAPPRDSRLKP
ncbi:DUF1097 domain-containing protein [Microbacterium alcoholitolerans]|uniref:DUF1097 domain-containing protein n=1 Tax=unclassified Microbacterium TaxID=2609290 RepID=UPI003D173D86